jgi:DNA-binding CsgD family transcriptional regulator
MLRRMQRAQLQAEERLRRASSAFMDVLEERFSQWSLTPAERDVALFAIKGMSTGEIAALRSTSEGTVKAQTNAIYRKAGVSGRAQLLAAFIDDLVELPANA